MLKLSLISLRDFLVSIRFKVAFLRALGFFDIRIVINFFRCKSQLYQDIFVLKSHNFKKNGYFVEVGVGDGVHLSNTYLLEKSYSWSGILVEPAKRVQKNLRTIRSSIIAPYALYSEADIEHPFFEADDIMFSTFSFFKNKDHHQRMRVKGEEYTVKTKTLDEILRLNHAPRRIDYLSIDTEGSEFEVLKGLDFDYYDISLITVEHNYSIERDKVFNLLLGNGFERCFTKFSKWDDWYIKLR